MRLYPEHPTTCDDTYLEVLNGGFATSPSTGRMCGDTPDPEFVHSQSDRLRVLFHSAAGSSGRQMFAMAYYLQAEGIQIIIMAGMAVV